jgi:hypothetical protein
MRQKTLYYMYSIEYTFSHLEPVASLMALRKITDQVARRTHGAQGTRSAVCGGICITATQTSRETKMKGLTIC